MEKKEKEVEEKKIEKEEKVIEIKEEKKEEEKPAKKAKKVKEKKKRKPINLALLFFLMLICFIGEEVALFYWGRGFARAVYYGRYGLELIGEISAVILIVAIIFLFKQQYVFTEKKEKFFKSLLVGLPFVLFATVMLIFNATGLKSFNVYNFISLLFLTLFVGVYEELLCRGWLQNAFVRTHNTSRGKVILSIILSSLVFGAMHITNALSGQSLFETLMQVLQATAMGFFLGAVYYRTRNIYGVMFMHFYWDLAVMIGEMNQLRDCTNGVVTNDILTFSVLTSLLFSVVYTCVGLYVLRKEKVAPLLDEPKEEKKNKLYNILVPILAVAAFGGLYFVEEPKDYENYETCYEYAEMDMGVSDLHYTSRPRYTIKENGYNFEVLVEDNELVLRNLNTKDKITLFESGVAFEVIKEKDYYMIVAITLDENNNESVEFSKYMSFDSLSDEKSYLKDVKESFISYVIPDIQNLGYLTNDGTDYIYPLMTTLQNNSFVIDENGALYLVNFTGEEYEKPEGIIVDSDPINEPEFPEEVQAAAEDPMATSEELVSSGVTEISVEDVMDLVYSE